MPVVIGTNARNDQGGCIARIVLLFKDGKAVKVEEAGWQL
jgi:hypothetical protein